jgi:hypothetical protein
MTFQAIAVAGKRDALAVAQDRLAELEAEVQNAQTEAKLHARALYELEQVRGSIV